MPTKRYFSEDDFDNGITPSQLKRLSKFKQLPYLVWWFNGMFEDPANETPYNGREGGYQYIWGGPYDASEELADEFDRLVSDKVIEQAIAEVESNGLLDWAPGRNHPDHDRAAAEYEEGRQQAEEEKVELEEIERRLNSGIVPSFGDTWEKNHRAKILHEIHELKQVLPSDKPSHGGVGHNNPPSEFQIEPAETKEIREATRVIRDELVKEKPDAKSVANAAGVFKTFLSWAAKKVDVGVDEFVKSFGKSAGVVAGPAAIAAIVAAVNLIVPILGKLFSTVIEWLGYVTLPF
jgi:hypothetical protein